MTPGQVSRVFMGGSSLVCTEDPTHRGFDRARGSLEWVCARCRADIAEAHTLDTWTELAEERDRGLDRLREPPNGRRHPFFWRDGAWVPLRWDPGHGGSVTTSILAGHMLHEEDVLYAMASCALSDEVERVPGDAHHAYWCVLDHHGRIIEETRFGATEYHGTARLVCHRDASHKGQGLLGGLLTVCAECKGYLIDPEDA